MEKNNKKVTTKQVIDKDKYAEYGFDESIWIDEDSFQGRDLTRLDSSLVNELKEKGLAWRFISFKKYKENGNYHEKGWRLYKRDAKPGDVQSSLDLHHGADPDGYVRRKDMVLAVIPHEVASRRRTNLDKRNREIHSGAKAQQKAAEMREFAAKAGLKDVVVKDGYDE